MIVQANREILSPTRLPGSRAMFSGLLPYHSSSLWVSWNPPYCEGGRTTKSEYMMWWTSDPREEIEAVHALFDGGRATATCREERRRRAGDDFAGALT